MLFPGFRLGLNSLVSEGAAAAPSLFTTADFTLVGPAAYNEILSTDSFRIARDGGGAGNITITGVPAGDYRITGTAADYDGAISVSSLRLNIQDEFTGRASVVSAGAFDETVTISSGTLRFRTNNNMGVLITELFIEV